MIKRSGEKFLTLSGEEGSTLRVCHSNRGEPYREGVEFDFDEPEHSSCRVFLERYEAIELRDLLNRLYP